MTINELGENLGEITVKSSIDKIEINRKTTSPFIYRSLSASYNPKSGELQIMYFDIEKGSIHLFDSNNDGKVETLVLNCELQNRNDDPESFLKADQKLAEYKRLLNVEEILAQHI